MPPLLSLDTPENISAQALPRLPSLKNELYVEVFTHRSVRDGRYKPHPEFGDSDRLAFMGETAVRYSVVEEFFRSEENLTSEEIKVSFFDQATDCI